MSYTYSSSPPAWWIAPAVIIPFLVITSIIIRCVRADRYRNRLRYGLEGGPYFSNNPTYLETTRIWKETVNIEANKRWSEEQNREPGSRVWFTRCVADGVLKYWVLAVDGEKFELRRDSRSGDFTMINSAWSIEEERNRSEAMQRLVPRVAEHYAFLVGWTHCDKVQLRSICESVQAEFGQGIVPARSGHQFLKTLATQIVSKQGIDWEWFQDNIRTAYQQGQQLPSLSAGQIQHQLNVVLDISRRAGHRYPSSDMVIKVSPNSMLNQQTLQGLLSDMMVQQAHQHASVYPQRPQAEFSTHKRAHASATAVPPPAYEMHRSMGGDTSGISAPAATYTSAPTSTTQP